jgi:hypothetical protein
MKLVKKSEDDLIKDLFPTKRLMINRCGDSVEVLESDDLAGKELSTLDKDKLKTALTSSKEVL